MFLKVYQLLYMPLMDSVFKEQTCATYAGRTQPHVKTHSKEFCLKGLVWRCLGPCLEVLSSARVLQRELRCWTRHSSSFFRGQVLRAVHPREAVTMCAMTPLKQTVPLLCSEVLPIYELLLTVGTLILSKGDTKLMHSSYLIRHSSGHQLLI